MGRSQLLHQVRYAKTYFAGMDHYLVFGLESGRWTLHAVFADKSDAIAYENRCSMQTTLRSWPAAEEVR